MPAEFTGWFLDLSVWIQVPAIFVGALVLAQLLELTSSFLLRQSGRLTSQGYDRMIADEIHLPLFVTIIFGAIYLTALVVPELPVTFVIMAVTVSVIIVVWARAVIRLGARIITITNDSPTEREIAPIFKNVLTFLITIATFFVLLWVWRVDVTPLLASAGVLGIIIGIAARDSLSNFFGGLSLHFDKTYQLGDMIELESGERGTVIDMSIRSTTILTRDNIAVTIPNSVMNSTQIINESAPVRRRRIRLNVGIAYGSDLARVEEAILTAADEEEIVMESPRPVVRFREFADSAVVAQLQCYIPHPAQRGRAKHLLIRQIDDTFDEDEIKIPFPQREVTFFEAGNEIAISDQRNTETVGNDADYAIPAGSGNEPDSIDPNER